MRDALARSPISGPRWVSGQEVLEVRQDELLMLLLVMEPQVDPVGDLLRQLGPSRQERGDGGIDVRAVGVDAREVGTRDQTPLGARMLLADRVVVGVVEDAE